MKRPTKKRRVGDWRKQHNDAHEALQRGEATIGDRQTLDVLDEALSAMVADGPVNGDARYAAARRLGRSAEANLNRSAHTKGEADADVIFEAARPLLQRHQHRTPWTKLAAELTHQLIEKKLNDPTVTANRLRLICRQRSK